jgi:hypothetical protein
MVFATRSARRQEADSRAQHDCRLAE